MKEKVADVVVAPSKAPTYKKLFNQVPIFDCDNCGIKHDRYTNCLNNIDRRLCPGTHVLKLFDQNFCHFLWNGKIKKYKMEPSVITKKKQGNNATFSAVLTSHVQSADSSELQALTAQLSELNSRL